jgi:hypothetical protein
VYTQLSIDWLQPCTALPVGCCAYVGNLRSGSHAAVDLPFINILLRNCKQRLHLGSCSYPGLCCREEVMLSPSNSPSFVRTLYPQSCISTPGKQRPASSRNGTMNACTPWSTSPPWPAQHARRNGVKQQLPTL